MHNLNAEKKLQNFQLNKHYFMLKTTLNK